MKLLFTLLLLCSVAVYSQPYVATWKGWGHEYYSIEQSRDSINWQTIATIAAKPTDSFFAANIPGPTYYYRVVADKDTSNSVLVTDVLAIVPDSVFHPQTEFENSIKIINDNNRLKIAITSQRDELAEYQLTDIVGRVLQSGQWFIQKGLNTVYLPFNYPHGIYIIFLQTAYGRVVKKVVK